MTMWHRIALLFIMGALITGGFARAEDPYDPYDGRKPGMIQCGEDRKPTPLGRF
jgi:hypothetical protein